MDIGYDGRPPSVCRCRGFYCSLPSLEVVLVSVSDVDRAKTFYAEMVGFHVDFDSPISEEVRVVQLTPPGSGCSIQVGKGITDMPPGSLGGLQLVVPDLVAARGARRARSGGHRDPGVQRGWSAPETRRRVPRQRRVRLLRRPGWQRLDRPADQLPRLVRKDI
jgi:catechol 2,3-dioxygenase-like lactoylglutathione lyase family enzyme